jgi:hypothetical protein
MASTSNQENNMYCRKKCILIKVFPKLFHLYIENFFKLTFKTGFLVHNIDLYLCWQVEKNKWILCSRKKGVKWFAHLRFLMYKLQKHIKTLKETLSN